MHKAISAAILSVSLVLGATSALGGSQREFKGEVISLDRGSKSIVVKGGEPQRRLRFFLARSGEVTSGGQPVEFADLKRGSQVEIAFTRAGSTHTAQAIAIVSGSPDAVARE